MAASITWDMPVGLSDTPRTAKKVEPAPEKIQISALYPEYDDLHGPLPPDRTVAVSEILHPAITRISDKHTGLPNAYVPQIYEMQRYVIPEVEIDKGDSTDLQAIGSGDPHIFLNAEHILLYDQENHLRDRHHIHRLKTRGNHDITTALSSEEEMRNAGLNIYPAVRTQHPDQRQKVDIHGHEPESSYMVNVPAKIASNEYNDIASRGEDAATTSKHITKVATAAVGLDHSLRSMSFDYDSDIDTGHTHRVRRTTLDYKKKFNFPTIKRELTDIGMTAVFGGVLWLHRTGALEGIMKEVVIPEFKKIAAYDNSAKTGAEGNGSIRDIYRRTTEQILSVMKKEFSLGELGKLKNVRKNLFFGAALSLHKTKLPELIVGGVLIPKLVNFGAAKLNTASNPDGRKTLEEAFKRAAYQFLPVLEKDPHISLFNGMTLEKMRPRFYGKKIPAKTASGHTAAVISTFGCFIDGRATYGATFADTGHTYALDWLRVREFIKSSQGLPDKSLSGNDLILDHFKTYGGLHPDTLRQLKFYHKYQGTLSDEDTEKYSRPPKLEEMPIVKMSRRGLEEVVLPNGRRLDLPKAVEEHEFVPPHQVLQELEKIDPRSANDLRMRMEASPEMRAMFEPRKPAAPRSRAPAAADIPPHLIHQPARGAFVDYHLAYGGPVMEPA